jgi:hypothetical protein
MKERIPSINTFKSSIDIKEESKEATWFAFTGILDTIKSERNTAYPGKRITPEKIDKMIELLNKLK